MNTGFANITLTSVGEDTYLDHHRIISKNTADVTNDTFDRSNSKNKYKQGVRVSLLKCSNSECSLAK